MFGRHGRGRVPSHVRGQLVLLAPSADSTPPLLLLLLRRVPVALANVTASKSGLCPVGQVRYAALKLTHRLKRLLDLIFRNKSVDSAANAILT